MTRRDLGWRLAGAAMIAGACLASIAEFNGPGMARLLDLLGFLFAMAGLVLLIQGRRVPLALRIERSRHRHLPETIWRRRRVRRGEH